MELSALTGPPPEGGGGLLPPEADKPSIFSALTEQLGLRLEAEKGPVDVLVVERVARPSKN